MLRLRDYRRAGARGIAQSQQDTAGRADHLLRHDAGVGAVGELDQSPGGPRRSHKNEPVTFSADEVDYDKDKAFVTATGHVEAWQNGHVMRADKITFDRNTGVAAATGHVVLLEPDGEVLFADYAEMQNNMNDGILKDMRALLQQNGRLAANGAQRTGGQINEMSKVVYTTCNLCAKDPTKPPLWQIRAASAVQDLEHKKIEFSNATLQMYGIPVAYMPYFWTADPSVKRKSGILPPVFGSSSNVGFFYGQPYYLVIDDQSDATFLPLISTEAGPQLDIEYRRRFNDGTVLVNTSAGYIDGTPQGSFDDDGVTRREPPARGRGWRPEPKCRGSFRKAMLVVEQRGVVEVGAFDVRRRPVGDREQLLDARPRTCPLDLLQPFAQGLGDDRVIVSPVARAIRCASRWASGSLMLRPIRQSLSRLSQGRLPFHSASLASSTSPAGTARAHVRRGRGRHSTGGQSHEPGAAGLITMRVILRHVVESHKFPASETDHCASQGFSVEARVSSKSATLRVRRSGSNTGI